MSPSLSCLFVLAASFLHPRESAGAAVSDQTVKSPNSFQECQRTLKIPVLEALPGGGWDNLRNIDMGRVMNFNYSQCRTTEDGSYLIPDDMFTVPQKQSRVEQSSELINNWLQDRSTVARSINSDNSFSFGVAEIFSSSLDGKLSTQSKRVKTHQVQDRSVTSRVQVRNVVYSVKTNPSFTLDQNFRERVYEIADALENNQTRLACYLSGMLVLNYGTHVVTVVEAGASLVQEDYLRSKFVSDSWDSSSSASIGVSAAFNFFKVVNFGFNSKSESSSSMEEAQSQQYVNNMTYSMTESHGGVPFYPGITLQKWQESISNNLVAIDRSGLPLFYMLNRDSLPGLPEPTINKVISVVSETIKTYYRINMIPGCLNVDSPNFNFQANVDDGSCQAPATNFTFGGVFQTCSLLTSDAGGLCPELEQKNPLTGDFSCPAQYRAVKLHSGQTEQGYNSVECHQECHTSWFIFKRCHDVCVNVYRVMRVRFDAYWCVAESKEVSAFSGYLFGGLYTRSTQNPLTKFQSCPAGFVALKLLDGMMVCVSSDYEMATRNSVPFGGFFSCDTGNPLRGERGGGGSLQKCPDGFSQHLAAISDGCQILYCVRSGEFTRGQLPEVRLPPFIQKPLVSYAMNNTVMELSEYDMSWTKDSKTKMWKITQSFQHDDKSLSPGSVVGVALGVFAAVVVITMGFYGLRKRMRRRGKVGYREIEEEAGNGEEALETRMETSLSDPRQQLLP